MFKFFRGAVLRCYTEGVTAVRAIRAGLVWEVFDPRTGRVVCRLSTEQKARHVSIILGLDYARSGEGY